MQVLPADPDTVWLGVHAELPQRQSPHTFNNIADALEAAADGDVIQLLPGTHIVSQVGHPRRELYHARHHEQVLL